MLALGYARSSACQCFVSQFSNHVFTYWVDKSRDLTSVNRDHIEEKTSHVTTLKLLTNKHRYKYCHERLSLIIPSTYNETLKYNWTILKTITKKYCVADYQNLIASYSSVVLSSGSDTVLAIKLIFW